MAKLFGAQRLVLQAIQDSPKNAAGYVSDAQVAQSTQIDPSDVRDWIETLEGEGYVEVARTAGGLSALPTAKGRLQLGLYDPLTPTQAGEAGHASPGQVPFPATGPPPVMGRIDATVNQPRTPVPTSSGGNEWMNSGRVYSGVGSASNNPSANANKGRSKSKIIVNIENVYAWAYHRFLWRKEPYKTLLTGIDFTIGEGKIVGIFSSSSSSRNCILELLSQRILPDKGLIHYLDNKGRLSAYNKNTIVKFATRQSVLSKWVGSTVEQYLKNIIKKQVRNSENIEIILESICEKVNLMNVLRTRISHLSGGPRALISFAASLCNNPNLVLLDEIYGGSDFSNMEILNNAILSYRESNKCSFLLTDVSSNSGKYSNILDNRAILENGILKDKY